MKNKQQKISRSSTSRYALVVLAVVIFAATCLILLRHSNSKPVSGTIKTVNIPVPSSKTVKNDKAGINMSQTSPGMSSSNDQSNPNVTLAAPYGSLVSNHYPGQNGSDMKELSQCTTTPGAKCYIKFTQGSIVRTLPEKTADSNGSIFWEWSINDAGLTSGKWTIEAVASLNGQVKSTADQLNLEIQ